jgi:hypothetical protein
MSVRGIALRCRSGRIRPTGRRGLTLIYAENNLPQLTFAKERKMSETILIGGKNLHRSPNQAEVFSDGIWSLHKSNQSPCGRYQNYRLYQDLRKAKKKVFHLSWDASTGRILQHHDVVMMQEYFPGLQEWVTDVLNGNPRPVPLEYQGVDEEDGKKREPKDLSGSESMTEAILTEISHRWHSGKPLSTYPQTRKQGRYAPAVLAQMFDIWPNDVDHTISKLMDLGKLEYRMHNSNTKLQGLCQPDDFRPKLAVVRAAIENVDAETVDAILKLVREMERNPRPWSLNPISRRSGRYLPMKVSTVLGMEESRAKAVINQLIRENYIEVFRSAANNGVAGLRVAKEMEMDNG